MSRSAHGTILGLVLLAWLGLGAVNVYWSDLNQDEGWYLYAARSVAQGRMPYRDFAFTQGPVSPFVYALGAPWVAARGLVAGRWLTFLLGGLTLLGVYRLARYRGGAQAALFAAILLAVNVYQSQFTTTVKTYALAGAFLVWGLLLADRALAPGARPWTGLAAGGLLALAAGTRFSAGAALPVVGLALLMRMERGHPWAWLWVGVGGALGLLVVFGPFLAMAPGPLKFWLFDYHAGRAPGGLATAAIYKAGFLSRTVQSYFVACAAIVTVVAGRVMLGPREAGAARPGAGMLWGVAAVISLVHLAAPFPYDDYQVMVYPVACAALGISLARWIGDAPRLAGWTAAVLLLAALAAAGSSPVNQAWVLRERDRIWWRLKETSPIAVLREAGRVVREATGEEDVLLTQDTYLAVEADRAVPRGMEMGPFSYYPDLDRETAAALRVTNREILLEILRQTDAPLAAVSGYGFAIASPAVRELEPAQRAELLAALEEHYEPIHSVTHFGQAQTTLHLYRRRPPP